MAEDLSSTIASAAASPKRAQGDEGAVEMHSLKDQIEADRYLANKDAAASANRKLGMRHFKLRPPGTTS